MLISKVTQTGFCGKIIDVHVHTGHWDKQCDGKPNGAEPYLVNDIFERADVETAGIELVHFLLASSDAASGEE